MPRELIATDVCTPVLREYEDVEPKEGQVLVRTEFSACKHGTEAAMFHGEAGWMKKKRDPEMRLFVESDEERRLFPVSLGNMFVGAVEKVGPNVEGVQVGDKVFGHGGARDSYTLPANRVREMPEGVTPQEIVCLDPAEFAYGAIRDGNVRIGDHVGVFGLGAIGLMCVQLAKVAGAAQVFAIDPVKSRREIALATGADVAFDPTEVDVALEIRKATDKVGLDVAIEYSGAPSALNEAVRSVGYGGTVAEGAVCKPSSPALQLGDEFHWNRTNIISTRACSEPTLDHPRWNNRRIIESGLELFIQKRLKADPIVTPTVPFAEAAEAYAKIDKDPETYIKLSFTHP
ncbi:MAG: zinc-binding dehydrogenase [Planctomycetes bacterium]|nr:zinc-binding dehydrogenase [Planctomycetota bacterium]